MSIKKVGWCRLSLEMVLDTKILDRPYLRDDMDVYRLTGTSHWSVWTPETQGFSPIRIEEVPEMIHLAMMMLS